MRVLVYGLMALALSLAAVLMGVHHSGADAHAAAPGHVAQSHDGVSHDAHAHDAAAPHASSHTNAAAVPDAHPAGSADDCATCGHDGESMLLVVCALLAVLLSLAAAVHPARTGLIARTDATESSRPRPPDDFGDSGGVDLDQLCVSRR